jgi:anti-anti-sigma regulatory factor
MSRPETQSAELARATSNVGARDETDLQLEIPICHAMQIYISKGGQRYGPYSVEELRQQLESSVFTTGDFASCDDGRSWIPIRAVPGIGPTTFTVGIDQVKNLLAIRYRGRVTASAVERCAEEVRAALGKMQSGFRLLADFTELESMDVACVPHIEKIMELCDEKGVCAVVRIIPDPKRDIGLQIMSYFHYSGDVNIVTCHNLSDATKILSQ